MKRLLTVLFCLCAFSVFGANPAFTDFTNTHFATTGNKVIIRTNWIWADAAQVFNGYSTNAYGAVNYGFSMNLGNTPNLQKALTNANKSVRFMFVGDSTGADSIPGIYNLFASNYLFGVSPLVEFAGPSGYFPGNGNGFVSGITTATTPGVSWWGNTMVISNGANFNVTFGIRNSFPALGNQIRFTYQATNTTGTAIIQTAPAVSSNTWTTVATVDSTTGPTGLRVTNIALASVTNVYLRISNSVPGTEGRFIFVWPQIRDTTSRAVEFLDGHVGGNVLAQFMAMGTNAIATLLTNFAPDVIFYQQKKSVASMDYWTNVAVMFKTFATNSDVVVIQSYGSADQSAEADPANGSIFQLPVQRDVAKSNNWVFIDTVTPFPWTNVIERFGFNLDAIHLNGAGQLALGGMVTEQLNLPQMLANSGTLSYLSRTVSGSQSIASSINVTGSVQTVGSGAQFLLANTNVNGNYFRLYMEGSNPDKFHMDRNADGNDVLRITYPFGGGVLINSTINPSTGFGADSETYLGSAYPWKVNTTNSIMGGTNYFTGNMILKSNAYALINYTNNLGVGDMWFWNSNGSSLYLICKSISGVVKTQQLFTPF